MCVGAQAPCFCRQLVISRLFCRSEFVFFFFNVLIIIMDFYKFDESQSFSHSQRCSDCPLFGQWEPPEVDSGTIHTVLEVSLLPGMKFYGSSELQSVISPKS